VPGRSSQVLRFYRSRPQTSLNSVPKCPARIKTQWGTLRWPLQSFQNGPTGVFVPFRAHNNTLSPASLRAAATPFTHDASTRDPANLRTQPTRIQHTLRYYSSGLQVLKLRRGAFNTQKPRQLQQRRRPATPRRKTQRHISALFANSIRSMSANPWQSFLTRA
jgi:hypothetical protein